MKKGFEISGIICLALSAVFLIITIVPLLNGEYDYAKGKTAEYLDLWVSKTSDIKEYEQEIQELESKKPRITLAYGKNSSQLKSLNNDIAIVELKIKSAEAEESMAFIDYRAYSAMLNEVETTMIIFGVISGVFLVASIVLKVIGIKKSQTVAEMK